MGRTRPRSRGGGGRGGGRRDSLSRRLHSAAQGFSTRPLGLDTLDRKLASSLQFPGDDGNLARAHASAERTNKCLRTSPDSWPRSPGTRCPVRVASSPAPRGSPAPRSSPGHPSERREGRWCGARGTGARSEPWRPPPAGREERGVEPGRIPREVELTRTGRQPSSAASVDSARSAHASLCAGLDF